MKRAFDLSIGQHLAIAFGLVLVLLATFSGAVLHWNGQSARAEQRYVEEITPRRERVDELERALLYLAVGIRAYVATPDAAHLSTYRERVARAREELQRILQLRHPVLNQGDLQNEVDAYLTRADAIMGEGPANFDVSDELALRELRERVLHRLRAIASDNKQRSEAAIAAMSDARDQVSRAIVAAAVLAALAFLALALLTIESIRRPTQEILRAAAALQRGDWAPALAWADGRDRKSALPDTGRSEMLHIARAFGAAASALEAREQRLRAEGQVAHATSSSLDPQMLGDAGLLAVVDYVRADVGAIYEFAEDSSLLVPIARYALGDDLAPVRMGEGVPGEAARSLRIVMSRDIPRDSPFRVKIGFDEAPPRCVVAVPMTFSDDLRGVLLIGSLRELGANELSFLERAASQLGIGLQNVRAYAESQRLLAEVREKSEQVQAQNEELQAQNEEIHVQNEEIQAQSEQLQSQQEEIQVQNHELKQQSEALRAQTTLLAEADERKNEFLGVLAHELRNPMAPIVNGLYILGRAAPDSPQALRARAVIERQTHHLTRLIEDLLDVTRIARGKVSLEPVTLELRELINACIEDQRAAIDRANLHVTTRLPATPVYISGDSTRICQVVGNLLHNAIKFTNRGGNIQLSLKADEAARTAELTVSDDGVGIDAALLPQLFQPFSQGASTLARTNGGLGLGLSLVRSLVELHGGNVEAYSDGPGRGARLVMTLPLSQGHAPAVRVNDTNPQPRAGRLRILVIEDNRDAAESLGDVVALHGHEVELAPSGPRGIECALRRVPDVVLCDIGLPKMDGYEVARQFRAHEKLRDVFLVALTGYTAIRDRQLASEAGFDQHLAKPANLQKLAEIFASVARKSSAQSN